MSDLAWRCLDFVSLVFAAMGAYYAGYARGRYHGSITWIRGIARGRVEEMSRLDCFRSMEPPSEQEFDAAAWVELLARRLRDAGVDVASDARRVLDAIESKQTRH